MPTNTLTRCQCKRCLNGQEGQCRYPRPKVNHNGVCTECRRVCQQDPDLR